MRALGIQPLSGMAGRHAWRGGGGMHSRGACMAGGHTWQGTMHGGGTCVAGGACVEDTTRYGQ